MYIIEIRKKDSGIHQFPEGFIDRMQSMVYVFLISIDLPHITTNPLRIIISWNEILAICQVSCWLVSPGVKKWTIQDICTNEIMRWRLFRKNTFHLSFSGTMWWRLKLTKYLVLYFLKQSGYFRIFWPGSKWSRTGFFCSWAPRICRLTPLAKQRPPGYNVI